MKKILNLLPVALLVAGLSACRSYDYYTAGLNKTNMTQYRSFAWMAPRSNSKSPLAGAADAKVKDAAVASLSSKGLQLNQNNPDLLVTYSATVGKGAKTVYAPTYYGSGYSSGWGFGYGYGWYRPYWGPSFVYYGGETAIGKEHYDEGTLIIDLIDSRTHKIVWRGFGVGETHKNQQKDIDDLPKVVGGIIDQLQLAPRSRS